MHKRFGARYAWVGTVILLVGVACSSSTNTGSSTPGPASQVIGAAGGTVSASDGTQIVIPPGALTGDVTITVALNPSAPAITQATALGAAHLFGPEGQMFLKPIEVTLPFDPTGLPSGVAATALGVYSAPAGSSSYQELPTSVADSSHVTAQTTHFCNMYTAYGQSASDAGPTDAAPSDGGPVEGGVGPTDAQTSDAGCQAGASCMPNTACGSPGFSCVCTSGVYVCEAGVVDSSVNCEAGVACSAGSACGSGSFSCSCQGGVYVCSSGVDATAPVCQAGAACSAGSACGGNGLSCTCQGGVYVCSGGSDSGPPPPADSGVGGCQEGAACSAGSGCANNGVQCMCVNGAFSCGGLDGGNGPG